jgi:hypothetical protein
VEEVSYSDSDENENNVINLEEFENNNKGWLGTPKVLIKHKRINTSE